MRKRKGCLSPGTKQTVLNNELFVFTIAKDCTERLSAVALSLGLIILRGQCVSGHLVPASFVSDTPPKCFDQDQVNNFFLETFFLKLKMSDAPSVLPFIFRIAFLHPLEKYQQQLSILTPICTLDGEIGDLKTKRCQLVPQNAGQVRSSKARAPRAFFFFLPASLRHKVLCGGESVRNQSSREKRNPIVISEFSTFPKINKSREKFLLRLTLFTLFTANG